MRHYTFILYLLLLFGGFNEYISALLETTQLMSLLILFLSFILIFTTKKIIPPKNSILLILVILFYLFFGGIISTSSYAYENIFSSLRSYMPSILIIFTLSITLKEYYQVEINRLKIDKFLIIFLSLHNLYTLLGYILSTDVNFRGESFILNSNLSAFMSNICLVLVLANNDIFKKLKTILILLSIFAILVTFSRTGLLLLLFIILIFISISRFNYRGFLLTFVIFLLSVSIYQFYFSDNLSSFQSGRIIQLREIFSEDADISSITSSRAEIAEYAVDKIVNDNFLGSGLRTFHNISEFRNLGVHNTYLLILGEAGFIPFLFYIYFTTRLFIKNYKIKDDRRFKLFSILFSIVIFSFTTHSIFFDKIILSVYTYYLINMEI